MGAQRASHPCVQGTTPLRVVTHAVNESSNSSRDESLIPDSNTGFTNAIENSRIKSKLCGYPSATASEREAARDSGQRSAAVGNVPDQTVTSGGAGVDPGQVVTAPSDHQPDERRALEGDDVAPPLATVLLGGLSGWDGAGPGERARTQRTSRQYQTEQRIHVSQIRNWRSVSAVAKLSHG